MTSKKESFESLMGDFLYKHDTARVFQDFLTMAICAFGQNPIARKSYDEDLYLETVRPYKDDPLRHHFPKLLATLTLEMEERLGSSQSNDVIGEYYEQHLAKKGSGQFFTPWHIGRLIAKSLSGGPEDKRLNIIDPCCGSGRLLVCGAQEIGREHNFFGIDIEHTCIKMSAINLFLNGIFHGELMCADALLPGSFMMSYKLSYLPFGVFRILEKEKSPLWHLYQSTFKQSDNTCKAPITLPSEDGESFGCSSQLQLF